LPEFDANVSQDDQACSRREYTTSVDSGQPRDDWKELFRHTLREEVEWDTNRRQKLALKTDNKQKPSKRRNPELLMELASNHRIELSTVKSINVVVGQQKTRNGLRNKVRVSYGKSATHRSNVTRKNDKH